MKKLVERLTEKNLTIGSCESLTAGLFASTMAEVPGASAVLKGGIITYWTQCKIDVVHVDEHVIKQFGVISGACAKEMAEKAKALLHVDICVSFTGNAGPKAMEGKPAGLVYAAIAGSAKTEVFQYQLYGDRNHVRQEVVTCVSKELLNYIETI